MATWFLVFCNLGLASNLTSVANSPSPDENPLVVFAVRHAEKVDDSKDPELSKPGQERAKLLAKFLRSAKIEHIHSSPFKRTRSTAAPTAEQLGKKVDTYDPRDLPALVAKLRKTGGRHLVVGHSNTTPDLVKVLGGEPGQPIDEKKEYDRLYVVTVGSDGKATTVLIRFGMAYQPKENNHLATDFKTFDQTPDRGWRVLAKKGDYGNAASSIEQYLRLRKDLNDSQIRILHFHAGQMHAYMNNLKDAKSHFRSSRAESEPAESPVKWNAYVNATIAFLDQNRKELKKSRDEIASGKKFNGQIPNLNIVDAMLANPTKNYREVYDQFRGGKR